MAPEVKRVKCIRCGLIFGAQYNCPHCHKPLERAYTAEPMRHLKEGNVCQFCSAEIDQMALQDIAKEKKHWSKFEHSGIVDMEPIKR